MAPMMKIPDVSRLTGTPEATLRYWRHAGTGPRSFKLGRRVMYKEEDVLAWIEAQYEAGTSHDPKPTA